MTRADLPLVSVLGDSRAFDTYYANADYPQEALYGYERTFPHLLRTAVLRAKAPVYDVVHVPDHFRGGSVESNSLRLALSNPAACVFLDGIWETLVNKRQFLEWAESELRRHQTRSRAPLDMSYSSRRLADLFISGALSVSPARYAERQRRLISYFRRRRRAVVWMSLPMPPPEHLDGLHFAGSYQCIPEWGECLAAVNAAVRPVVEGFEATWLDLHALMEANGGAGACLIDQWHFSCRFHAAVADALQALLDQVIREQPLSPDHPSHRYMLPRTPDDTPLTLIGDDDQAERWRASHPTVKVADVTDRLDDAVTAPIAVLFGEPAEREQGEAHLLARLPHDTILLYPEELEPIRNPTSNDRAEFAERDLRS